MSTPDRARATPCRTAPLPRRIVGIALLIVGGVAVAQEASRGDASDGASDVPVLKLPRIDITSSRDQRTTEDEAHALDAARDQQLFPKLGTTTYGIDRQAIESLPQGTDTPLDKLLLQAPGVSYDSAVSNVDFHVRNEYANVQYRIDGIQLPEGVSGIGSVLETGFVGNLKLLDGVLPAQYGLRTAAVVDITTKPQAEPAGDIGLEAGGRGTFTPRLEYGGTSGASQYDVTARYVRSRDGIENPAPTATANHDRTQQGKVFGFGSTLIGDASRVVYIAGASSARYQIPTVDGRKPLGDFGSPTRPSSSLDENQRDAYAFAMLALQTSGDRYDAQLSASTRYADVHFMPDIDGDLAFNDVAADVRRRSVLNGIAFDAAYRLGTGHTVRAGVAVTAEKTHVENTITALPLADDGTIEPIPTTIVDANAKLGWNAGLYVQDEWTIASDWTLNGGLRFDALRQYVSASQISPRVAVVYQPAAGTSVHAGYARYFTPPMQVYAAPSNIALFDRTTEQPPVASASPARPERSHDVDVGIDQTLMPGLDIGVDAYIKRAKDFLDDGQFGDANVFSQFNFARGRSKGVELKIAYRSGGLRSYLNVSANKTQATQIVSNGYLFPDADESAYIANHDIYTDDAQTLTASAGASYRSGRTVWSVSGIFGSGLRSGFANTDHVPGYVQIDAAVARQFDRGRGDKPLEVRLGIVNLFDRRYLLRSGDGVGEFAPQYGPRRKFFVSFTQTI